MFLTILVVPFNAFSFVQRMCSVLFKGCVSDTSRTNHEVRIRINKRDRKKTRYVNVLTNIAVLVQHFVKRLSIKDFLLHACTNDMNLCKIKKTL